jgi:predicted nuclease of predicted toxin-antitoxin system
LKFLIDECLSVALEQIARDKGYIESAHVNHRGMSGWIDSRIAATAIEDSWTIVTRNSDDFRPRSGSTAKSPCYAGVELHAGLICLNLPDGSRADLHEKYFRAALSELAHDAELTNEVIEVSPNPDKQTELLIVRYDFP